MPGFGHGPFGRQPFGRAAWSRHVLFDSLPGIYRQQDEENGGLLEALIDGIRPSFDIQLSRVQNWDSLRDPLTVRTKYDVSELLRLGQVKDPDSEIEQRGVDAMISASRSFTSPTARFRAEDVGKTLTLYGSGLPINNRSVKIATVLSTTSVRCDPSLVPDAGPLRWEVKGFPVIPEGVLAIEVRSGDVSLISPGWVLFDGASEINILSRSRFYPIAGEARILTEREGANGQALADGRFQAETIFTQRDVGKPLTLFGSAVPFNNGKFEIRTVVVAAPSTVTLHEPITLAGATINGSIEYTLQPGNSGVRIAHVVAGISTLLSVFVNGLDITIHVATDGAGVATSTANALVALITGNVQASAFLSAVAQGTGAGIVSPYDLTLIPGISLKTDGGSIGWAMLPFPEIRIASSAPPLGVVEQENIDLEILGSLSQVTALSGKFSAADVGKNFIIRGSALGSDGVYPIATVIDAANVTLTMTTPLAAESDLAWEVRTVSSTAGDTTKIEVHAPSLIEYLAADFALTMDEDASEARQRSWVDNATQWLDMKGVEKSYEIIGLISGFDVTALGLYRISKERSLPLPAENLFYLPDPFPRAGIDGKLTSSAGRARLHSTSATFYAHDVGSLVRLANCSVGTNNALFEIIAFVDSHTIEFDPVDAFTAPDNGVAGTALVPTIDWELRRIYTDKPPSRARFDEVNVELMQDIVGANNFLIDSYCWETDFIEEFPINITDVDPPTATGVPIFITVEVTGVAYGVSYSTARVIGVPAAWEITDADGRTYAVESMPVMTGGGPPEVHTFQVFGGEVPAIGGATLRYLCDASAVDCNYCRSAVVLAQIVPGSVLTEPGADVAKASLRVISRLETEIKPTHVRLISRVESDVAVPIVFTVIPGIGNPGDVVVINGEGFTGTTAVKFDGTVSAFTVDSDTQITATVPAGSPATSVDITIEK